MKYFGGCDVGSTYTKCVILDEEGKDEIAAGIQQAVAKRCFVMAKKAGAYTALLNVDLDQVKQDSKKPLKKCCI